MQKLRLRYLRPLLTTALVVVSATTVRAQQVPADTADEAPVTLTAEERARYVATYEMSTPEGPFTVTVSEQGDRLMALPQSDADPTQLIPLGEHRFRPEAMPAALVTFAVDGDRAINFTIDFNDERGTVMAFRKP